MLQIKNLSVSYGAINALHGISLQIKDGDIVTLIGANGAGKTTTLKTISGLLKKRDGEIFFDGKDISSLKPHQIVKLGISHVPEGRMVFANLTVREKASSRVLASENVLDGPKITITNEISSKTIAELKEIVKQGHELPEPVIDTDIIDVKTE